MILLGHSVQSATHALRDESDVDWVVSALLHDIGDIYTPYNHDECAAPMLRPFIREQCAWVVEKHGDFQMVYYVHHVGGNPNKRDICKDHPYFDDCVKFCERWVNPVLTLNIISKPLKFLPICLEKSLPTPLMIQAISEQARKSLW